MGLSPIDREFDMSPRVLMNPKWLVLICEIVLEALECLGENARRDEEVAIARPT